MNLRKAKTIDQLYEEVKDYDFVLSNDAALVTALNAMVTKSRLDGFAFTPKILASMIEGSVLRTRPLTDLEVVESIEKETGFDFRYIHSEVENIRDIRRYTENVSKYLYSQRSQAVFEAYDRCPTTEKVMSIFDSSVYRYNLTGKKVAVIGLKMFNDLDKHMLPPDFDEIDPFIEDEEYEIGTIYGIGNDRQIAGSIVDLINPETANETAIVLDPKSPVADAVRSAMYRKGIPFKNNLLMKDLAQVRDYLQFVTLALDFRTIRVRDVRELFSVYQKGKNTNKFKELTPKEDGYLLHKVPLPENTDEVTRTLIDLMRNIRDCTFAHVAEVLYKGMPQLTSVLMLLKSMDLEEEKITSKLVNKLSYAVNNVDDIKHNEQVPENEKYGVLLADCCNSTYVDRSFVIFIGLDGSWEVTAPGKEYVDKEQLDMDNAYRMGILLQQGTTRIYAVKPAAGGKNTIPCITFQTLLKKEDDEKPKVIEKFEDICQEYRMGSWFTPKTREPTFSGNADLDPFSETDWKFSKTAYNAYRDCPIQFMFSKLLHGEDKDSLMLGICLHEFAELYFCYPDTVREKGVDYYLQRMDERYAGLSNECQKPLDASKFRVYSRNLMKYIDMIRPAEVPLDVVNSSKRDPNELLREEGLEMCSSLTESSLNCNDPIFAKADVCIGGLICDYKTGSAKEQAEIIKAFVGKARHSEFQALIYLAVLSANTDERCEFDLFFTGDNYLLSSDEGYDIRRNIRKVILSKDNLIDVILAPNGPLRDYADNTKKVNKIDKIFYNWDRVIATFREYMTAGNLDTEAAVNALIDAADLPGRSMDFDAINSLIGAAKKQLEAEFVIYPDGSIVIPSDIMETFLEHVREDYKEADRQRKEPIYKLSKGRLDCADCQYRNVCLKAFAEEESQ